MVRKEEKEKGAVSLSSSFHNLPIFPSGRWGDKRRKRKKRE
jgi:hypothetical protein